MSDKPSMFPPPHDWHAPPEIVVRRDGVVYKIHIGCLPDGSRILEITAGGAGVFNTVLPSGAAEILAGLLAGDEGRAEESRQALRAMELRAEAEREAALPRAASEI